MTKEWFILAMMMTVLMVGVYLDYRSHEEEKESE